MGLDKVTWYCWRINPLAKAPTKDYESAGWDVYCVGDHILSSGDTIKLPTGLGGAFAPNHVAIVYDRSSMGAGAIPHFAGVIDWDYRGQMMIVLCNLSKQAKQFKSGDKICQIIIHEIPPSELTMLPGPESLPLELLDTKRGTAGFGSTGGNVVSVEQGGKHDGNEPVVGAMTGRTKGQQVADQLLAKQETIEAETQDELETVPLFGPEREAFEKQVQAANEFKLRQQATAQVVKSVNQKDEEENWKKK